MYRNDENYNGLKRTSGFIDLNNIESLDKTENEEIENQLIISVNREEKETIVQSGGLTKETIEEVEVELEKVKGTFGISIVVSLDIFLKCITSGEGFFLNL